MNDKGQKSKKVYKVNLDIYYDIVSTPLLRLNLEENDAKILNAFNK